MSKNLENQESQISVTYEISASRTMSNFGGLGTRKGMSTESNQSLECTGLDTVIAVKCVWFISRILIRPREYLVARFAILKYGGESTQKSSLP
jgi:hypothetical protein